MKPKHIKSVSKTPLNACQCVYCTNVNEKLKVLCIPGLNNEQDVYKKLICKKTRRFRNQKCIFQICTRCKNWENKLKLLACKLDMKKMVSWKTWQYVDYTQTSGKIVSKRMLIIKHGPVHTCLKEFIGTDILKPGLSLTFVKHYFTHSFQFQVYLYCKECLKPGLSVVV